MRDGVRYVRPGRPRVLVDADVAECLGIHWAELAADRKLWASAKVVYMMYKGAKLDSSGGLGCYPFHYSNKTLDLIGPTSMLQGMSVVFKVDSVLVANQVKGLWALKSGSSVAPYLKYARWALYVLQSKWKCAPVAGETDLVQYVPQSEGLAHAYSVAKILVDNGLPAVRCLKTGVFDMSDVSRPLVFVSCTGNFAGDASAWAVSIDVVRNGVRANVSYASCMCKAPNLVVLQFLSLCMGLRHFVEWCAAEGLVQ